MPGDETEEHWFRVINNSGAAQKYIFFAPPPTPDFYTPAWIASDDVNNETVWNVHTTAYLYAGMLLHYMLIFLEAPEPTHKPPRDPADTRFRSWNIGRKPCQY